MQNSRYYGRRLFFNDHQKLNEAIVKYSKAIELDPNNATNYNSRGKVYYNQHKLTEALADYNKAIELDIKYAKAYYNRAIIYDDQGKLTEALVDFSMAIKLDYVYAYNNRAIIYYKQDELAKALADFSKAIELDNHDVVVYSNRSLVYYAQGKFAEAIADNCKALDLKPGYTDSTQNLGFILQENTREDIFKAIKQLPAEKAIYLLFHALNENTLLGQKFLPSNTFLSIKALFFKDPLLESMRAHYRALITDRVTVRLAARIIAQGKREQNASSHFHFFTNIPEELGVHIASFTADTLSQEEALKIAFDNFDKPSIAP